MVGFLKKYAYPLGIAAFASLAYFRLFTFSIFSSSDWLFEYAGTLAEMPELSTWTPYATWGPNVMLWRLLWPNSLLFGLFWKMGFDSNVADKFLVFWPIVFLTGLAGYFLVEEVTKSETAGLVGSMVLAYNSYFLAIDTQGHLLLTTASAFLTFAFLFFIRALGRKNVADSVSAALLISLAGFSDFRIFYLGVWLFFFYFLFHAFVLERKGKFEAKPVFVSMKYAVLSAVLAGALNVFWLLPAAFTGSLAENDVLGRSLFGNGFLDVAKAMTLFHPFWKDGTVEWFAEQSVPLGFWLIPVMAFLGLALRKKNDAVLFFGCLALLGIFLSKQVGIPFSGFYEWAYQHFPGFNAFREATKFYYFTALGYAVLIGSFASFSFDWLKTRKFGKKAAWAAVALIVLPFTYDVRPMVTGEIGNLFVKKEVPAEYRALNAFLDRQEGFSRTFWVPRSSRWGSYGNSHPKVNAIDASNGEWLGHKFVPSDAERSVQERLTDVFFKPESDAMFDDASVRYVVVPLRDVGQIDDFYRYYGGDEDSEIQKWYVRKMDSVPWLKRVDAGTSEIAVYENLGYGGRFRLREDPASGASSFSGADVAWKSSDPSEFGVSLKGLKWPSVLEFSEKYHPDWKLRLGGVGWVSALFDSGYFLDDSTHSQNRFARNEWKISASSVTAYVDARYAGELKSEGYPKKLADGREDFKYYVRNADGSVDAELTAYFKPQAYFRFGTAVSLSVFALCLAYLAVRRFRPGAVRNKTPDAK